MKGPLPATHKQGQRPVVTVPVKVDRSGANWNKGQPASRSGKEVWRESKKDR